MVILFNLLMGSLFAWNAVAGVAALLSDQPEWERPPQAFDYAVVILNALVPICLFVSAAYHVAWRKKALARAATLQFTGASSMTAWLVLEFFRPNEGGVGGFLFLLALPFFVSLNAAAWLCALYVRHVKWAQRYAAGRNNQDVL